MGECSSSSSSAAAAKTSVWWDIDRCAVPRGGCDPHRIAHNIIVALAAESYTGPVSIFAYGDAGRIGPAVTEALSSTGISLNHVPAGAKDGVDKKMLVDMLFWAFDNPPPGNYLLLSGDQDFSGLLHRLRMKKYDILLAQPPNTSSQALANAAKTVWLWESLAAGSNPGSVPRYIQDSNGSDASKCSRGKVRSEYSNADGNVKAVHQHQVRPLQKYVQKTNITSSSAGNRDRVDSASSSARGSTVGDCSSFSSSSSSSSESMEGSKGNQPSLLGTPNMSQPSDKKSVVSTHSQQVGTSHKYIVVKKPSSSTECVPSNGTLDFGVSHYYQSESAETQKQLCSEYNTGHTNGKSGTERNMKPLRKYVKKKTIACCSVSNQVHSNEVYEHSGRSTTSELGKKPVVSAHLHQVRAPHKFITGVKPSASSGLTQKPVASTHLHQVRSPHEIIFGLKPSTSTEHASTDEIHNFGVSMGDDNAKAGNQCKVKQQEDCVQKTNFSSNSACIKIVLANGVLGNSKGSIFSHPSQSMSLSSCSESLERTNINQSNSAKTLFSLSSAHKSGMPIHSHQEGEEFIFSKKPSTSIECTPKNGIFYFGATNGYKDPAYEHILSSLLPKQHNSGPQPSSALSHSYSTNSNIGSSLPLSAGHNDNPSPEIRTSPSDSTIQGLPDICAAFSRLTISECPQGTGETRLPLQVAPADCPAVCTGTGDPKGLHDIRYTFHPCPNVSYHLDHSCAPHSVQPPPTYSSFKLPEPPNLSCIMQNPGNHGETQGSPPNSSEPEDAIRIILHALDVLKTEKIFPTESNIADCIIYGEMNLSGFDVKKALELALRHQVVIMKKLVNDMPLFVPKDESLWKCVDATNSNAKHPRKTLDTVCKYISSTDGHSAMKNSQSRYQAATILKKLCLQHHALGDVLQILHIVIVRKWLVPHSSGWQPLSFNRIMVDASTNAIEARS